MHTLFGGRMLQYIILTIVCVGMIIFAVTAAYVASEEKSYRYDVSMTDEHEI
jgi:hypothetical protein